MPILSTWCMWKLYWSYLVPGACESECDYIGKTWHLARAKECSSRGISAPPSQEVPAVMIGRVIPFRHCYLVVWSVVKYVECCQIECYRLEYYQMECCQMECYQVKLSWKWTIWTPLCLDEVVFLTPTHAAPLSFPVIRVFFDQDAHLGGGREGNPGMWEQLGFQPPPQEGSPAPLPQPAALLRWDNQTCRKLQKWAKSTEL